MSQEGNYRFERQGEIRPDRESRSLSPQRPQRPPSSGSAAIFLLGGAVRPECQTLRKWLLPATQVRFALAQEWEALPGAAGSSRARSEKAWSELPGTRCNSKDGPENRYSHATLPAPD